MRNFLAVILAIVAGVTASVGLVSWKLDGVINQPEPIQDILGSGEAAEQLKAAVPDAIGAMASDSIDIAVVGDAVNSAVSSGVGEVTEHEDFDQAWAESLEQTRADWVARSESLRGQMDAGESIAENATDSQLQLHLDPVAEVGVSVLNGALSDVPGATDGLDLQPELTVDTSVPPVTMLTAEQVVLA